MIRHPRSRAPAILALAALALAALAPGAVFTPARAQRLVTDLSDHAIAITSNFRGADLLLFGTVQADDLFLGADGINDIVVVVRGPRKPVIVRRKERTAGIWINRPAVRFREVPAYYAVASSRPLEAVAPDYLLERHGIGARNLEFSIVRSTPGVEVARFKEAVLRHRAADDLFIENVGGVRFVAPSLFRTTLTFPAKVPVGNYHVEVYLFREGRIVSAQSSPLYVDKSGIERWLFTLAHESPFFYGLIAVAVAVLVGWTAAAALRQR